MIIVKISSGLGNQMFQYAAARSLAFHRGEELLLDTTWYEADKSRRYELGLLSIKGRPLEGLLKFSKVKLSRRRYKYLRAMLRRLLVPSFIEHIIDREKGFDERLEKAGRRVYIEGYWQSELYFAGIRDILLKEFQFANSPDKVNGDLLVRIVRCNAVCVHVRRGDYTTTTGRSVFAQCDLDYYRNAMTYLRQRIAHPHFFLFSDDPEWARTRFHESVDVTLVAHNVGRNDYEDLRLMMNCRHFIIANSSFSWWAAWLGSCTDKIVVAPKHWYVSDRYTDKDLVPRTWIRL